MARESEKRRIAALINAARRRHGGPDLSRLNDEQRSWFVEWRKRQSKYIATFKNMEGAYAASLDRGYIDPNPLRMDIQVALYGDHKITVVDTEVTAAEKYRIALEGLGR